MIERQNDAINPVVMAISTFSNHDAARQFGTAVVEAQLAACVNLIHAVTSIYKWKGRVEEEAEVIAVMKTTDAKLAELEAFLQENHPYDEPEFVVLPVEAGSTGYLDWVRDSVAAQSALDKPST